MQFRNNSPFAIDVTVGYKNGGTGTAQLQPGESWDWDIPDKGPLNVQWWGWPSNTLSMDVGVNQTCTVAAAIGPRADT